jgi:hypothetical protein
VNNLITSIMFLLISTTAITAELPWYAVEELERNMRQCTSGLRHLYSHNNFNDLHENLIFSHVRGAFEQIEHRNSKKNTLSPEDIGKISAKDMELAKQDFYQNLEKQSQAIAIEQMKEHDFNQAPQVFARHKYLCKNVIKANGCDCENELQKTVVEYLKNDIDFEQKKLMNEIVTTQTEKADLGIKLFCLQTKEQILQKKLEIAKKKHHAALNIVLQQANN